MFVYNLDISTQKYQLKIKRISNDKYDLYFVYNLFPNTTNIIESERC